MSSASSSPTAPDIRLDIQGLRALAVLAVVAFHLDKSLLPSGFVGVDMFFVISGFIITSLLLKGGGEVSLTAFYWGRAKRILPAYVVMLVVTALAAAILLLPPDYLVFKRSLTSALKFTSNQFFSNFNGYFHPEAYELPLLHTWSLAIEMQFYLLLPLCFLWLRPSALKPVFLLLTLAGMAFALWQHSDPLNARDAYFSLLARVPEFMLGGLAALYGMGGSWTHRQRAHASHAGMALIVSSWVLIPEDRFPGLWSLWPCLGVVLVIAGRAEGRATAWVKSRGLVWLGGLSYSLYLWHWPILALLRYVTQTYELAPVLWPAFAALTLLVSWLSWSFIETPARAFALKDKRLLYVLPLSAALVVVPLLTLGRLNSAIVSPITAGTLRYADPATICHAQRVGECLRGAPDLPPRALVLGDSHAAQLNRAFDTAGQEKGFSVQVITASNCVPIDGFDTERIPTYDRQPCLDQARYIRSLLPSAHTAIIAGMWSRHASSPVFLHALRTFLEHAARRRQPVIVMAQVPMLQGNPVRSVRFHQLGLPTSITSSADADAANEVIRQLTLPFPNVRFLDYGASGFFASKPFHDGELIYMDHHHLNEVGAQAYGHLIASEIYSMVRTPTPVP